MTLTPEDITGQKSKCKYCGSSDQLKPGVFACGHCRHCGALGTCAHSSMDPRKTPVSSRLENFLTGLMSKPNPSDKELYLGDKPPDNAAEVEGMIDRQSVVDIAKTLTDRVSEKLLIRVCDAVFNDGVSIQTLQKIASMKLEEEVFAEAASILRTAGLCTSPLPMENVEAVVGIARALLQYVNTHHGGDHKIGSFKYERVTKTPFTAWRIKEEIQHQLRNSQPILVNPGGFDSKKQVDQFYANFNIADIVLWNKDIWFAAIRGCTDAFMGTKVGEDIISSVTPMFWQMDTSFTLGDLGQYQSHNSSYDCVGFCLLPITEEQRELTIPQSAVSHHEKLPNGQYLVKIEPNAKNMEDVRNAFDNAVKFARYGISVAIIFMPWGNKDLPPEVRFMRPMFEGDEINDLLQATILATAKFLTLKYVAKDNAPICKKELKQDRPLFKKVRQGKVEVPPIKIVNLRRPERREQTKEEAEHAKKRNYKCWFMVDAHWRKQFYPTLNRHIQIRIMSYPKGDMTKEFKPPREKIYKAVR